MAASVCSTPGAQLTAACCHRKAYTEGGHARTARRAPVLQLCRAAVPCVGLSRGIRCIARVLGGACA